MSKKNGRPWWASPDLAKRLKGVERVPLLGVWYEIPVTEETMPLIRLLKGEKNPWPPRAGDWRRRHLAERAFQDVIQAIYLQVRDTVGDEVTTMLTQQISDGVRGLVRGKVMKGIDDGLARRALLEHKPKASAPPLPCTCGLDGDEGEKDCPAHGKKQEASRG